MNDNECWKCGKPGRAECVNCDHENEASFTQAQLDAAVQAERDEQIRDCEWAASTWLRTTDEVMAVVQTVTSALVERIRARSTK